MYSYSIENVSSKRIYQIGARQPVDDFDFPVVDHSPLKWPFAAHHGRSLAVARMKGDNLLVEQCLGLLRHFVPAPLELLGSVLAASTRIGRNERFVRRVVGIVDPIVGPAIAKRHIFQYSRRPHQLRIR